MKRYLIFPYLLIFTFISYSQARYDVIIDEIFADPTPSAGLPLQEWIEIKNISTHSINLEGWRLGDGNSVSGAFPAFVLAPDSFVIISSTTGAVNLKSYGATIGVSSFPSFDNESDQVYIESRQRVIIHGIYYSDKFYRNELKRQGGWSLEMINTALFCAGSENWTSSLDPRGGSPGKANSVTGFPSEYKSPGLLNSYASHNDTIILLFDRPVDNNYALNISNFTIDHNRRIVHSEALPPLFEKIKLAVNQPLEEDSIYSLRINEVVDCYGQITATEISIKTGMAGKASKVDLVINEILFNPKPNCVDYVEIYNASNKLFDASELSLANRSSTGTLASIRLLTVQHWSLLPGDYILLTEEPDLINLNYLVKNPAAITAISSLPSMPDDEGTIVLLNKNGEVVDELNYSDKWHYKLLQLTEGVSLERLNPKSLTQLSSTWHSASSSSGYGTPGYKNSQFHEPDESGKMITVTPLIFSPNNDGIDDLLHVEYHLSSAGYSGTIRVFDHQGRIIKALVNNELLGTVGNYSWDGCNEFGELAPRGIYIILFELFNLEGKKIQFKKSFILAV